MTSMSYEHCSQTAVLFLRPFSVAMLFRSAELRKDEHSENT